MLGVLDFDDRVQDQVRGEHDFAGYAPEEGLDLLPSGIAAEPLAIPDAALDEQGADALRVVVVVAIGAVAGLELLDRLDRLEPCNPLCQIGLSHGDVS